MKLSVVIAFTLVFLSCNHPKKEPQPESFPRGQNVVFKNETLVGNTEEDYDEMMRLAAAFHPPDAMISIGRLRYIPPRTHATVIEDQHDTIRVLITEGPSNGYTCWTSKQSVTKVFPLLPTSEKKIQGKMASLFPS